MFRVDPGLCPICDAPHCGCSPGTPDAIVLLSQRDALVMAETPATVPPELVAAPVVAPEPFTTASYTRKTHGQKRPRRP